MRRFFVGRRRKRVVLVRSKERSLLYMREKEFVFVKNVLIFWFGSWLIVLVFGLKLIRVMMLLRYFKLRCYLKLRILRWSYLVLRFCMLLVKFIC